MRHCNAREHALRKRKKNASKKRGWRWNEKREEWKKKEPSDTRGQKKSRPAAIRRGRKKKNINKGRLKPKVPEKPCREARAERNETMRSGQACEDQFKKIAATKKLGEKRGQRFVSTPEKEDGVPSYKDLVTSK